MPQIANQDYLTIPIANLSSLTSDEKALLRAKIAENTILDAVVSVSGVLSRVIGVDPTNELVLIYNFTTSALAKLDASE